MNVVIQETHPERAKGAGPERAKGAHPESAEGTGRPILVTLIALLLAIAAVAGGMYGMVWRPGSIVSDSEESQFGMLPMIVGTIVSTFGAALLGVPLSIGAAILLAEIAPQWVREIFRPAIELLAGIPSVVFGLFGMVVLAPAIRFLWADIPYNTGFGLLNASIILAVMIIPTITNIAEDAIRSVPKVYKEGSLALGSTHWQAIRQVIVPGARSGIVAALRQGGAYPRPSPPPSMWSSWSPCYLPRWG